MAFPNCAGCKHYGKTNKDEGVCNYLSLFNNLPVYVPHSHCCRAYVYAANRKPASRKAGGKRGGGGYAH